MGAIVHTEGLSKSYDGTMAVDRLDLNISAGQAVGLIGPNGAGKSTLIYMLLGLVPPTSGRASVFDINPAANGEAVRQRVGYVPERHHIYGWMTVAEVFGFTRAFYPTWNDGLCDDLVKRYALPPDKKVKHLSHGMGTKLSLILALAHEPDLLVLDEPTTGLDPIARNEFVEEVSDLLSQLGKTVLFSSHILGDIERIADIIAILHNGKLLTAQPREHLLTSTKRVRVALGNGSKPAEPPASTVVQRVDNGTWSLTIRDFSDTVLSDLQQIFGADAVTVSDMQLEDVFRDFIAGGSPA